MQGAKGGETNERVVVEVELLQGAERQRWEDLGKPKVGVGVGG